MFLCEGHWRLAESTANAQESLLVQERIESGECSSHRSIATLVESVDFFGKMLLLYQADKLVMSGI
jgi:hypothetical protein